MKGHVFIFMLASILNSGLAFAQTQALEVIEVSFCGVAAGQCDRKIDVIEIDPLFYEVQINPAATQGSKEGGVRVFFDSLFNYAANTQANAVISGGFIRDLNPITPLGGLKVEGNRISRLSERWKDSSVVCADDGRMNLSREFATFEEGENCLQSGPTIFDQNRTEDSLRSDLEGRWPDDFWDRKTRRVVLLSMANGTHAFLVAHEHSYLELHAFLNSNHFEGNAARLAMGLNGGDWSGYIVRTKNEPKIVGDIDFVFPSVFVVQTRR